MSSTEDFAGPNPNPYLDLRSGTGDSKDEVLGQAKFFTIPPAMSVMLFGPEVDIVDTPEFQRLAGIKQLGMSYQVYRGATHTRFEHSLGTLAMAQKMIDAIRTNPKRDVHGYVAVTARAIRVMRLAALLHDLPHIPFGHTLEDEFRVLTRHDDNATRIDALMGEARPIGVILRETLGEEETTILRDTLLPSGNDGVVEENRRRTKDKKPKLSKDEQIAMLCYPFVADIVGNTVCADLLDYTARDMHNTGLVGGLGDRFLSFLTITENERMAVVADGAIDVPENATERSSNRVAVILDKKGMPRPDVESEIVKLLTYRYELAERVYLHHAKNAASAMLVRAVRALRLHERDENFHWLSDDTLLDIVAQPELAAVIKPGPDSEPLRFRSGQLFDLSAIPADDFELARSLGRGLKERRLYKIAYLGVAEELRSQITNLAERFADPAERERFENVLADSAGVEHGQALIHCLSEGMMRKDADVRVQTARGAITTLTKWDKQRSKRIDALNQAHEDLWRIAVYIHPDLSDTAAARLIEARMKVELLGVGTAYHRAKALPTDYVRAVWEKLAGERSWPVESWGWVEQAAADFDGGAYDTYTATADLVTEAVEEKLSRDDGSHARGNDPGSSVQLGSPSPPEGVLPLDLPE